MGCNRNDCKQRKTMLHRSSESCQKTRFVGTLRGNMTAKAREEERRGGEENLFLNHSFLDRSSSSSLLYRRFGRLTGIFGFERFLFQLDIENRFDDLSFLDQFAILKDLCLVGH